MPDRINRFIIRCSRQGWLFIAIAVLFGCCLGALMAIGDMFPAHTGGFKPFDLQNSLTQDEIFSQLASYDGRAFQLYYLFTAIDYVFPLAGSLFIGAVFAFSLRHAAPSWYEIFVNNKLFLLFLIPAIFDWTENIAVLSIMLAWPDQLTSIAALAVLAKKCKLATLYLSQGAGAIALIAAALRSVVIRLGSTGSGQS